MKKRFISLFTGAGGLDQGFINAGWEPAFMVDNWKPAVATLEANHPDVSAYLADLSNDPEGIIRRGLNSIGLSSDDILCIVGGPPCQTFSRLNQNQLFEDGTETEENLNDPRRSLFMDFLRVVRFVHPPFMVMENVFDLKTRKLGGTGPDKDRAIISVIVEEIEQAGYRLAFDILRTQDYNVPQMRKRMIFIGVRKDLDIIPSMPQRVPLITSVMTEFAKIRLEHPNQDMKTHSAKWIEKIQFIPQGGYYNNLPLQHKVLKPVAEIMLSGTDLRRQFVCVSKGFCFRAMNGTFCEGELPVEVIRAGGQFFKIMPRMGTYMRRIRETISHTVTRNPLIHPIENREITVREKAAIQTFSPEYRFIGTTQEQHVLVGNAVPCNLGMAVAEHIKQWLP
jgi:DNA (cytosine-5)-methyltransferase 1